MSLSVKKHIFFKIDLKQDIVGEFYILQNANFLTKNIFC